MPNSNTIEAIFIRNRKLLENMLYSIVRCQPTVEDLVQEAYIRFAKASSTQRLKDPQPYLYQIAKNLALDHLRKERVRKAVHALEIDSALLEEIPSASPGPSSVTSHQQKVDQLLNAMQDLPRKRRQILILRRVHGLKIKEIASHMKISESAVEKNLRMAVAHCVNAVDHGLEK